MVKLGVANTSRRLGGGAETIPQISRLKVRHDPNKIGM